MKSNIVLLALAGLSTAAQAQTTVPAAGVTQVGGGISSGTISLGGSIGYNSNTSKTSSVTNNVTYTSETKSSHFNFSPSVGYFLADNLELGLNFGYNSDRRNYTKYTPAPAVVRAELDPTTTIQIGPYVRYYNMLTDQFGVSGTLTAGFQRTKSYEYSNNSANALILENKGAGFYANLTPAIVFFPVPKFAMSASIGSLGYTRMSFDYPETPNNPTPAGYENTFSTFGANFGLSQLSFGGTYYFGR